MNIISYNFCIKIYNFNNFVYSSGKFWNKVKNYIYVEVLKVIDFYKLKHVVLGMYSFLDVFFLKLTFLNGNQIRIPSDHMNVYKSKCNSLSVIQETGGQFYSTNNV